MTLTSGIQQKFWVKPEVTFDTVQAHAATDAVNLRELKLDPELAMEATVEHVGTASHQGEITGTTSGKWSAVAEVRPAAAGTAPDIGEMLKAGFYTETVSGGTSVTYSFADAIPPRSLQLVRIAGSKLYEVANGAWVEQIDFELPAQGAPPLISFSGGYASHGMLLGGASVDGIHSAPDTSIQLQAGDAERIRPGVYVYFADETNTNAGYLVTAVDHDTDIITISPTLAGDLADDDALLPVAISQTLGGSVIGSVSSVATIGGTSVGMISCKLSVATGIRGLMNECTTNRPNRLSLGRRVVNFEGQFYFLDTGNVELGKAWEGATTSVAITIGSAAGARIKLNIPKIRCAVSPIEVPDADDAVFTLKGQARQSAAAADECTVVFD